MCATASPSDVMAPTAEGDQNVSAGPLAGVRVDGGLDLAFARIDHKTRLVRRRERDGYKVRTPVGHRSAEAVIINTGGGVAGGDRISIDVAAGAQTDAVVTSAQAERIYGTRQRAPANVTISLTVGADARLAWLPQETILFDGSRFCRALSVDLETGAGLVLAECTVLGRGARGERFSRGSFRDRWRVRRGGRLVFAETIAIEEPIPSRLDRPGAAPGAAAFATALYVGRDADTKADRLRRDLADIGCAAVTTYDDLAIVRVLADSALQVRTVLARALEALNEEPLPRVWST